MSCIGMHLEFLYFIQLKRPVYPIYAAGRTYNPHDNPYYKKYSYFLFKLLYLVFFHFLFLAAGISIHRYRACFSTDNCFPSGKTFHLGLYSILKYFSSVGAKKTEFPKGTPFNGSIFILIINLQHRQHLMQRQDCQQEDTHH